MSIPFARQQAERLAEQMGEDTAPVNVKRVAQKLGLRVVEANLGEGVSGLLITGGDDRCICVQADDHVNRKRFTIAHEIGHYHLKHQFKPGEHVHVDRGNLISQRSIRSSEGVDPMEVEANQFAACLLMPSGLLRVAAAEIEGPLHDDDVQELADAFGVSEQAMTIRLSTLRLL